MAITYQYVTKQPGDDARVGPRRLRVYTLLDYYKTGETPEEIAEDRGLPLVAVHEALAYAADHPAEMEAIRAANAEAERQVIAETEARIEAYLRRKRDSDLP